MNTPAIAKKTFDELKNDAEHFSIYQETLSTLQKIQSPQERARIVHQLVDHFNSQAFAHPLVKELSPCQAGCSACCFTQVSVTQDEAILLLDHLKSGTVINEDQLQLQADCGTNFEAFSSLKYSDRKCVFLDSSGRCEVYADRPSVCRTNAVLGDSSQCDTSVEFKPQRLVRTTRSDMVIYASYVFSQSNGTLASELLKLIESEDVPEAI